MALDKDALFSTQREVLEHYSEAIDSQFLVEYSQHVSIAAEKGQGFFDFHHFEHFLLGRADCLFYQDADFCSDSRHYHYGIQILLSGQASLSLASTRHQIDHRAPEIWLSKGDLGATQVRIPAQQRVRNILIEFNADFVEQLGKDAHENSLCKQLMHAASPGFIRLPTPVAATIKMAWQLYEFKGAVSHLDLIAIQGATISFISHLLNTASVAKMPNTKARACATSVKAVLEQQFAKTWTTKTLARQAGINECDLKRAFKALTGTSINQYQRSQRMHMALDLLQKGENNLTHIADCVGYHSKDYFVRVFCAYYGFHPKSMI